MKQKVLRFLREYQLCFFLCGMIAVSMALAYSFRDVYYKSGDLFSTDLWEYFCLLGMPILSLVYGVLSYAKVKKVCVPLLILFAIILAFLSALSSIAWIAVLIISLIYAAFSLIGTGVTALALHLFRAWKEAWKDDPKSDPEVEPIDETD